MHFNNCTVTFGGGSVYNTTSTIAGNNKSNLIRNKTLLTTPNQILAAQPIGLETHNTSSNEDKLSTVPFVLPKPVQKEKSSDAPKDDVIGEMVECEASVLKQPSTKALVKDYRIMYNKFLMSLL